MQLRVEAYSKSIACALIDAGHLAPPWLLPHRAAGEGNSERSVPADARMRKQVASYSLSPADVATQGNTVKKASDYLADPQSADHVQHELSEINHQVKQNTLEAPRFQTFEASNSMASPPLENGSLHSNKSNFLEGLDCVSCPLPENGAIDIVDNIFTEVSQGSPQTDVPEETYSIPIVLLDKEAEHSSETTSREEPFCLFSPKMENDLLHTIEQSGKVRKRNSLLDRCDNESSRTLEQQSSGCHVLSAPINESALQLYHLADTSEAHDVCVWNNIDIAARPEALSAASSKRESVSHTSETNSIMLSGKNADHVQHVLSDINHHVKQNTLEPVSSLEVPQCATFEGPNSIANPLLENDSPDSAKPDFLEGHDFVSCPLPEIDAIATVENVSIEVSQVWGQTDSREGTYCMPNVLLDNDKSHCVQTGFPEETDFVPSLLTDKEASQSSETRSFCLVSPKIENDLLHTIQQNDKLRKRKGLLLDRCDMESSRILEQQSSALQLYHLADTTEAHDVCVSNNIAIYARPEALSAASSKRAKVSQTLERNSVMSLDRCVPMLECQSFSIPVPSGSPTITERALQGFCDSKKLVNFCSCLSVKYKIKPLNGVYQSLPSRFENLMNRSLSYSIDSNLLDPSYASKYSLDFDDAFMMSNGQTSGSSNVYSVQEDSDVPSTLSFEKYDLEKLPATNGSSSGYHGSISGFGCSKIDEDSTILGGNENQAKLSHSIGRNYSRQCFGGRKPLGYATNIYQSKGTSSLDLTAGKSYIRKPDKHVHIIVNQDIKNLKEVRALSTINAGKVTHHLLRDRLRKTEMSCSKSERNRKEPNHENGCRPRNTVSNLIPFIPLAKQNQQPPKSCAKRDVRVRALKVAATAKRREEKKQTEREVHKAAVKLALERSKQEKEHRQKQVEHKKKAGADFITRKRQIEGDGKRENDRKKKCAEEAPKHQKQLEEIIHSPNTVKDACPKDTDGKDLVENLVEREGNQLLSDERMESVQRLLTYESNSVEAMHADCNSAGSGLQVLENLSDNVDKSYGMTPYEDSDAKDFKILEHRREIRHIRKLIPSWAQEENLDKILVSNLALDSREVFAYKCSAILSDVLTPGIPHRPFN